MQKPSQDFSDEGHVIVGAISDSLMLAHVKDGIQWLFPRFEIFFPQEALF